MGALESLLALALVVGVPLALRTPPPPTGRAGGATWFARTLAIPAAVVLVMAWPAEPGIGAGLLALPWLVAALAAGLGVATRLRSDAERLRPGPRHAEDIAVLFWLVGAVTALADRLGIPVFGFDAITIRLTVVHFHVAGVILVIAGAAAWRRHPARWLELALGSLVVGVVVTAIGFVGPPLVNWAGAMLVVAGALGIGAAHVWIAVRDCDVPAYARLSLGVAGIALFVSMPLAAVYATARVFGLTMPALDLMIATHGAVNVLCFALPSMLGWWQIRRTVAVRATDPGRDPRRLGRIGAALALACAAIATVVIATQGDPGPPGSIPAWLVISAFVAVPGVVATIAVRRGMYALLPVAGVMCLLQAFVAFSGVLLPFIVPGAILIAAAGSSTVRLRMVDVGAGVLVGAAWIGAWVARLAQVDERCWPIPGGVSCSSGVPTSSGTAIALSLVIVALAVAALAPVPASQRRGSHGG